MMPLMQKLVTLATLVLALVGHATTIRADVCGLTSLGSTCAPAVFGAIYANSIPQPTGTTYIDPFLRLQANSVGEGYKTSGARDLLLSEVPLTNADGTINEATGPGDPDNPKDLLSLDQLQIFLSPTGH